MEKNMSETIGTIAKALCSAQKEFINIERKNRNPFFNSTYADLGSIIAMSRPHLATNGLAITQIIVPDTENATIDTVLLHESGEWISSRVSLKPTKNDPQGMGSALTYARRYSLSAILGLATEDDDDGNTSSSQSRGTGSIPAQSNLQYPKAPTNANLEPIGGNKEVGTISKEDTFPPTRIEQEKAIEKEGTPEKKKCEHLSSKLVEKPTWAAYFCSECNSVNWKLKGRKGYKGWEPQAKK